MQAACPATSASSADAIARLKASARRAAPAEYAGDVSPQDAWDYLRTYPALLVDVRTHPEWLFVGMPDLHTTSSRLAAISWKTYPQFAPNPQFLESLAREQPEKELPLFFLCRSGGRSLDAAVAATHAGYTQAFNVAGGFEGEPDARGHRGMHEGWKAAGLPWKQG